MKLRKRIVGSMLFLFLLVGVQAQGADIIEDFRSVTSNVNIAAEGQTSSPGLVKHENSTYAWGGWNNAPADSINAQLRYTSSREVQHRGDASLAGSYLVSRFGVACKLGIIEFNKTRSSRRVSFLVRDAATQNWYGSDIVEQEVGTTRYNVTELSWWLVVDGNAELNGDAFVPLTFGEQIAWTDITIDGGGVHCDGEGASPLEWDIIKFLEAGSNQAPEVTASEDQTTYLSEGGVADVNAAATDDGLPDPPAALTFTWSVLNQPEGATVTFLPSAAPAPPDPNVQATFDYVQATFDTAGKYTLQVEAGDGDLTATDTVDIDVYPKPYDYITLTPEDDVFVRSNRSTTNQNGTNLRVRGTGWLSYIKFDVYGLTGPFLVTGAIKDAKLRLYAQDDIAETRVSAVAYGPSGEWDEEVITWDTDDMVWGDILDEETPIVKGQWYEFDVSAMVIGKDGKVTLGLDAPNEGGNRDWAPKETGDDTAPQLVLIVDPDQAYAPLPLDGGIEVDPRSQFTILSWYPGAIETQATANTVYMSTDPEPFANPMAGFPQTIAKEATNPTWLELNLSAELDADTTYYWGVHNGLTNTKVWAFTTMKIHPDLPISLTPADGATDVIVPDEAAFTYDTLEGAAPDAYNLYVSSDQTLVETLDASVKIANVHEGYDPDTGIDARSLIDFVPLTTYYYRFEGTDGTGGSWPNPIRSFTTSFFVGAEDFENGLTDGNRGITWTGSVSLGDDPNEAYSGGGYLRLEYAAGASNATATFDRAHDWEDANIDVLTLFVRGTAANADATVSVILEDATGATTTLAGDVNVTDEDPWQAINLDLANLSIDLATIKKLTIAVTGTGSGTLYVDDIRLYAPVDETELLGFAAHYSFDVDGSDASPSELDLTLKPGDGDATAGDADAVTGGSLRLIATNADRTNGGMAQRENTTLGASTGVTISIWTKEDGTMDTGWAGLFNEGIDRDPLNAPKNAPVNLFRAYSSNAERLRWQTVTDPLGTLPQSGMDRLWYVNGQDGPDVSDQKWHHIAVTYDANDGYGLYVDGLLRTEAAATGVIVPEIIDSMGKSSIQYGLIVGAQNALRQDGTDGTDANGYKNYFSGWIDEITCYTKALSAPAIDRIYRQGPVVEGDLDGDGVID